MIRDAVYLCLTIKGRDNTHAETVLQPQFTTVQVQNKDVLIVNDVNQLKYINEIML